MNVIIGVNLSKIKEQISLHLQYHKVISVFYYLEKDQVCYLKCITSRLQLFSLPDTDFFECMD